MTAGQELSDGQLLRGREHNQRRINSPGQAERLSRSPHPYRRRRLEPFSQSALPIRDSTNGLRPPQQPDNVDYNGASPENEEGRPRRSNSWLMAGSGSEADDESSGLLKGLPAPPLVPRKGLRDSRGTGVYTPLSPVSTPGVLEGLARNFSGEFRKELPAALDAKQSRDEGAQKKLELYRRRRRAEVLRRGVEVTLVVAMGYASWKGECGWVNARDNQRAELATGLGVLVFLLVLYPLRVMYHSSATLGAPQIQPGRLFRLRTYFDPAPLLYPPFLPIYVALCLKSSRETALTSNIVLGLSSLPPRLIPGNQGQRCYSIIHWVLSVAPLIVSEKMMREQKPPRTPQLPKIPHSEPELDFLTFLYPLHQTLLAVLHHLTKTSLLESELQLLSVALINLLIHSRSPQGIILKALLWDGGVSILVLCGPVLRRAVTLARIPKWRFRRSGQASKANSTFFGVLRKKAKHDKRAPSDADEDGAPGIEMRSQSQGRGQVAGSGRGFILPLDGQSHSASEDNSKSSKPRLNGSREDLSQGLNLRTRRHTMSTVDDSHSRQQDLLRSGAAPRPKTSPSSHMRPYLALTTGQAIMRKWLYASYVYVTIVVIVFGIMRLYVNKAEKEVPELIGWAIGYLFGDIKLLRSEIERRNLQQWICLPPRPEDVPSAELQPGIAEHIRNKIIGAANTRLLICAHFLLVLAIGMVLVLRLTKSIEVDTRRKVFHGMMVVMFLPATYIDPPFASLALSLVLALFLLLDLLRASQLPPLSKPLATFLTPYVDGRDLRGPVVISHIFLLVGCAVPLWLSLAATGRRAPRDWDRCGGHAWDVAARDVGMVSGVVCVGMGDAAASLVGRRFGRRKWPWSGGKSIEGSLAFFAAVVAGLFVVKAWMWFGGWAGYRADSSLPATLAKIASAAAAASLTEAVLTGGNDNVVVPVVLWLLVRTLRI